MYLKVSKMEKKEAHRSVSVRRFDFTDVSAVRAFHDYRLVWSSHFAFSKVLEGDSPLPSINNQVIHLSLSFLWLCSSWTLFFVEKFGSFQAPCLCSCAFAIIRSPQWYSMIRTIYSCFQDATKRDLGRRAELELLPSSEVGEFFEFPRTLGSFMLLSTFCRVWMTFNHISHL